MTGLPLSLFNGCIVTGPADADEVAAASGLVMGKADGVPAAVIRGVRSENPPLPASELIRPPDEDLFRESPLQAIHARRSIRAFGPGSEGIPERYRSAGQPVFVPGSMGTASYVLAGTGFAMSETFGSTCHGAGRLMSRHKAKQTIDYNRLRQQLHDMGIEVRAASAKGLIEEAPAAYKDVEQVVDVMAETGVTVTVARLVPIAIVKG